MSPRRFVIPALAAIVIVIAAILLLPSIAGGPGDGSGAASPTGSANASGTGPSASAEPQQVRLLLGFQPDVQFAPFYLAQQAGYFQEAGLEVTIEHSDDVIPLVADGQSEFGVADATDVMIARTSGIPIKYVSTLYGRFPVALIGAPDVVPDSPADLAGLRIGTPGQFGSSWHALLAQPLEPALRWAVEKGHQAVHPWDGDLGMDPAPALAQAMAYGRLLGCYVVNDPDRMKHLAVYGLWGFVTDVPDVARAALGPRSD